MLNIIQGEGDIYITPDEHAKYYTGEGDIYITPDKHAKYYTGEGEIYHFHPYCRTQNLI
jgi:hypothetical protein